VDLLLDFVSSLFFEISAVAVLVGPLRPLPVDQRGDADKELFFFSCAVVFLTGPPLSLTTW